jgi:hypothetical protein
MLTQYDCRVFSRKSIMSGKRLVFALLFVNFILAASRMPAAHAQDSFSSGDSGDSGDQGSTGGDFNGGSGGGPSSSAVPNVVDAGYEAAARRCNTVLQQQGNFDNFPSCGEGGQGSLIEWCRHHQQQDAQCIAIVAQADATGKYPLPHVYSPGSRSGPWMPVVQPKVSSSSSGDNPTSSNSEPTPTSPPSSAGVRTAPAGTPLKIPPGGMRVTVCGQEGYIRMAYPYYYGFNIYQPQGPVQIQFGKNASNQGSIFAATLSGQPFKATVTPTFGPDGYLEKMTLTTGINGQDDIRMSPSATPNGQ